MTGRPLGSLGSWRPALRIAARDARRTWGRTLIVVSMVGLPVLAGTAIDVAARSAQLDPRDVAAVQLGDRAEALVTLRSYGSQVRQLPDGTPLGTAGAATGTGTAPPSTVIATLRSA